MAVLTEDLKKKFVGFDEEGNPVFDADGGKYNSLDKNEFAELTGELKSTFQDKKFNDTIADRQADNLLQDKNYLGQDAQGNSVFQNQYGVVERAKGAFTEGLKRKFGDVSFDKSKLGVKNQVVDENKFRAVNTRDSFNNTIKTGNAPKLSENRFATTFGQGLKASYSAPKPRPTSQVPKLPDSFQSNFETTSQEQSQESDTPQLPQYQQEDPMKTAIKSELKEAKSAVVKPVEQALQDKSQPYTNQIQQKIDTTKATGQGYLNQLKGQIPGQAIDTYNQSKNMYDQAKTVQQLVSDPKQAALGFASGQASNYLTSNLSAGAGNIASSVIGGKSVADIIQQQAMAQLQDSYRKTFGTGAGANMGSAALSAVMSGGNVTDALKNTAISQAQSATQNALQSSLANSFGAGAGSSSGAALGASALTSLLTGGDTKEVIKNTAEEQAKQQAMKAGMSAALGSAATPAQLQAAIEGYKILKAGGNSEQTGDAAARAAARVALASATGGASEVINPETMQLASSGYKNLKDSKTLGKAGVAGDVAKGYLGATSGMLDTTAMAGNEAMNVIGGAGADFFKTNSEAFKDVKSSVNKLKQGDIASGVAGIGSSTLKTAFQNLIKNPASAIKSGASAIKNVVSSIFCFDGDTLILMADGTEKKIKDIDVGDEVALGNTVTLVSKGLTDFIYDYKGIIVSGGHGVLEDGKWKRVSKSRMGKKLENHEPIMVYSIATQTHLMMTSDYQIWLDIEETEDTFNKTDDDIIKELNGNKKLNKILASNLKDLKNENSES